jgi:hypothetical protein
MFAERRWDGTARDATRVAGLLAAALVAAACGGGGGGHSTGTSISDPIITLSGPTGQYSQTPSQANLSNGKNRPPVLPPDASGKNQFLRLEVPFNVVPGDVMSPDPLYRAFSQLTGNLAITDELGNHLPGIVMVNGVDAFGKFRGNDVGFPHDFTAGGQDRNVGRGVILYVADDGDGLLSTVCAFGGTSSDSDSRPDTTDVKSIRVSLDELNGHAINAFYTVTVDSGVTGDVLGPKVLSVVAESPDPTDPLNPAKCSTTSRFIVKFSEPCVPTSVGKTASLDPLPFYGNLPLVPTPPLPPPRPLPATQITATLNSTFAPLYLPFDLRPLNSNNLATYVITPLVDLPGNRDLQLVLVDSNANKDPVTQQPNGTIDLSGNFHAPGADVRANFHVSNGRAPVNAPVSPEVFYWLPIAGRGMGAVDLDGHGMTTNTPGKWDNTSIDLATGTLAYDEAKSTANFAHAPLVTRGAAATGGGALGIFGIGNRYAYPVGLTSYRYGPALAGNTIPFKIGTQQWQGSPTNQGNPGTPIPGINEGSSGFETLVRDATGSVLLTGGDGSTIGPIADMVVGDFLDAGIFDTQSVWNRTTLHTDLFWGGGGARNFIGDPPAPNPPPSRYWVGLSPIDVLIDQTDPLGKARIIEGAEVFAGTARSYGFALPNPIDPLSYDVAAPPGGVIGPNPQTASSAITYTSRQQVGNYLYLVDTENRALQVVNSNTFQTITTIDVPDPAGVAIMPNNRYVFTSNAGDDTMSIIGADPTQADFHKELGRVRVGRGPGAIACQMNGEDVFVASTLDNAISIVQLSTLTVRKTITSLIDEPRDMVVTPRYGGFGWNSGVYFTYIANFGGNSVLVYESGPSGPQGIGCDNILGSLPKNGSTLEIFEPRSLCYSPYPNEEGLYAGGVFVCHRDSLGTGLISHIQFTHQAIFGPLPCVLPPGRFYIPPGFNVKIFDIVGQWGDNDASRLLGSKPSSVDLIDYRYDAYTLLPVQPPNNDGRGNSGFGGRNSRHPIQFLTPPDPRAPHCPTIEPDRMYVSFEDSDQIQILDPIRVGVNLGAVKENTGIGIKKLVGYYNSQ